MNTDMAGNQASAGGGPALEITRVLDAPPDRVFRAWTDPGQVRRWWGPAGFSTPHCAMDLRPGGAWHICMRSPEGRDYWSKGVYQEIVPGDRIVTTDFFSDEAGNRVPPSQYGMPADWPDEAVMTVTFRPEGDGRTRLSVSQGVPELLARESGAVQGWSETLDRLAAVVASPATPCPFTAEPQAEHRWLQRLVGEWTSEVQAIMEPGQPPATMRGTESVRSLGGLWVMGEGHGGAADGEPMTSIITLGFDPAKGRFVGSFVASMMTHQWLYEGTLDGNVLTLDTEGPDFSAEGRTARYQDIVEVVDDDHRMLRSRMLGQDGQWREVMTAHYRRVAGP